MSAVDWSPGLGSLSPAHHISMLGKTILASVTVSCCWLLLSRSQPLLIPCCPCVARLIDTRCYSVSSSIVGTTATRWSQSCVGGSLTPRCRCTRRTSCSRCSRCISYSRCSRCISRHDRNPLVPVVCRCESHSSVSLYHEGVLREATARMGVAPQVRG